MSPIYFSIDNKLPIMVIPDVKIHHDGHEILTYSYSIFFDGPNKSKQSVINNKTIIKDKKDDPNYYGFITFEGPDGLFSYTPEGTRHLTITELKEIIEQIKHYRDNPALWRTNDI